MQALKANEGVGGRTNNPRTASVSRVSVSMAQWIGDRQRQEDHMAVLDSADPVFRAHAGVLAVLADGMGGMAHGEAASRLAVATFLQAWERKSPEEDVPAALLRALGEANARVVQSALDLGCQGEMGCTLIAVSLLGEGLHWVAVGDSALLHLRGQECTQLNTPHTFGERLDEEAAEGLRTLEEAAADPQRAALTSFLGLERLSLVDRTLRAYPLQAGDQVIAASDGLTNALRGEEILRCTAGDSDSTAHRLLEAVKARKIAGQDNTSVVSIRVNAEDSPLLFARPSADELTETPDWAAARPAAASASRRHLPLLAKLAAVAIAAILIAMGIYFGDGPFGKGTPREDNLPPEPAAPSKEAAPASEEAPDDSTRQPIGADDPLSTPGASAPAKQRQSAFGKERDGTRAGQGSSRIAERSGAQPAGGQKAEARMEKEP